MGVEAMNSLVARLNDFAIERIESATKERTDIFPWNLSSTGSAYQISFMDYPVWDSARDGRLDLKGENCELLEAFLLREAGVLLEVLACTLFSTDESFEVELREQIEEGKFIR